MNPVLLNVYNTAPEQLEITKKAIKSILAQDVGPLDFYVEDDGSTPETAEWANLGEWFQFERNIGTNFHFNRREQNISPMLIVNETLCRLFHTYSYVFLAASDVILPINCYREFLKWPRGVVTGVDIGQNMPEVRVGKPVSEGMLMNVMLVRKWAWEAVVAKDGYFYDPNIVFYASDCDLAVRFADCGIKGCQLDVPYWHYGSMSHRLGAPEVGNAIRSQADIDREYFAKKYGFECHSEAYGERVNRYI
jgi:hypothetical protein